ncbi:MAG: hypothetical protein COA65_00635 [Rhodospirillaceae bacterium]|nr:MAG: hypothetical protein COA65_00635 [Rhodospirillaceae bacterium]
MTFIFYDTETTGLSAGFDQILQFAALVTDDDFNVIEEVNLRCRLQSHVVPSPGALLVTGVRPSDIQGANLSHYQMVRKIRNVIEQHTPAVIVGYNSISYDESMLRQAFYQTLNPVYLTNMNGNTRMDMLRVAHAVSEYAPDVLQIPLNDKGRPSFKLGLLAAANGLVHEDAHEAMSDTLVTLGLARLVRAKAPKIWEAMYATRAKRSVQGFMADTDVFCFTDKMFKQSSVLATQIAPSPENSSQVAVFDLSHDPVHYLDISKKDMVSLLRTTPRPIRVVKANQQPILASYEFSHVGVAGHDLPIYQLQERARQVKEHPTFADNVAHAIANRYPEREPSKLVEEQIYNAFPSWSDQKLMEQFHQQPWEERLGTVLQLTDDRLGELGERLIYTERPDALPEDVILRRDRWRHERIHAEQSVQWVTAGSALEEVESLRTKGSGKHEDLFQDIEMFLGKL